MEEFQLKCVKPGTDELTLENCHTNQNAILECAPEYSIAIITIQQDRCVLFRFAWRPALDIKIIWFKN